MVHRIARSVILFTVAVVVAGGVSLATPPPADAAGACPAVVMVAGSGTWENPNADGSPVGMLAPVADTLEKKHGKDFEAVFPQYPAQAFTGGVTYGDSKSAGVEAIDATVAEWAAKCPSTKFLLAGYSQGADAAGNVASSIGCKQTPVASADVLAVGLVADPRNGTEGGKPLGDQTGTGIAGPRPDGFCDLSAITATICAEGDTYCATDAQTNPVLASVGRVLAGESGTAEGAVAQSLASPVDRTDLEQLPANLTTLTDPASDPAGVPGAASQATNALRGLGQVQAWAQDPAVSDALAAAPEGSDTATARGFLQQAQSLDVAGAVESIEQIAAPGAPLATIGDAASRLSTQVEPVTAAQGWSAISSAVSVLQPQLVIDQVLNVVSNGVDFAVNVPAILTAVEKLPAIVFGPGDFPTKAAAVRDVFRELNTLCEPLVRMAAGVDLHMVADVMGAASILDSTGAVRVASAVVDLVGNADVMRIAQRVGELQEAAWTAVITGDILGALLQGFGPALDFADIAVDALTGAPKETAAGRMTLAQGAESLTSAASSQGMDSLATLIKDGVSAATFFASGVHQSYSDPAQFQIAGLSAVDWLAQWFDQRMVAAGV